MIPLSGVIFLDKPQGWTSRQGVNAVIRRLSTPGMKRIKAGHGGTLDPLATGMLPILVGEATRYADYGLSEEKSYTVSLDLSFQTDTLDMEGEVTARFEPLPQQPEKAELEKVLKKFIGKLEQIPPAYSAIRVDGKRAHQAARQGKPLELATRAIEIKDIQLLAFEFPVVTLHVRCSKGTYIRSLARDIGLAMRMGGCVTRLRRTSTGGWPEALMVSMDAFEKAGADCMMPLSQWLRDLHRCELSADEARRFLQGQRLQVDESFHGEASVFCHDILLGNAELKPGMKKMVLHPVRILPSAQEYFL